MITNNPMQLKARIKNLAAEKYLPAQIVLQNYLMERLLERLSLSSYRENYRYQVQRPQIPQESLKGASRA